MTVFSENSTDLALHRVHVCILCLGYLVRCYAKVWLVLLRNLPCGDQSAKQTNHIQLSIHNTATCKTCKLSASGTMHSCLGGEIILLLHNASCLEHVVTASSFHYVSLSLFQLAESSAAESHLELKINFQTGNLY